MDKQLLKALDNLSKSLEMIAEVMQSKKEGGSSDVTKSLQSGNFIEQIKEINIGVKAIRKDTQEILRQQRTILEMSKKNQSDKKTDAIESDPKKESSIKKGVASILLIAVAVLAIGLAFKIIGKIDFLSVIGLGIAIVLVAVAFEKVAKLNITRKQAIDTSIAMVIMAGAVMISSLILSNVKTISIMQGISIMFIAFVFHFVAPTIASMIKAMTTRSKVKMPDGKVVEGSGIEWGMLIKSIIMVPMIMMGMSLGIMVSSYILGMVKVITIGQAVTSILIAGVFAMSAGGIVKLITALRRGKVSLMDGLKAAIAIPLIMLGFAAGIWLSSMVLGRVQPIGLAQAVSSILIALVFSVAAFGMSKILRAFRRLSPKDAVVATLMMPLVLPAMAVAIWLSSKVLNKVEPLPFSAFLGSIMIALLFVVLSFAMKPIAKGIKAMNWGDIPKIPVFFLLISIAIAAAAFILYKAKEYFQMEFMTMLKILVLGAVIGVLGMIFAVASKILGNISWGNVVKLPLFFTLITMAIAASAFILYKSQQYFQIDLLIMLKILILGVIVGILGIIFGFATKIIGNISWANVIKLPFFFTMISLAVAVSAFILNKAMRYIEGMSIMGMIKLVIFGIALAITVVVMAIVIKILKMLGGVMDYLKGGIAVVIVATTIMIASLIINKGKYEKYPDWKWVLGVGLAIATIGVAAYILGITAMADMGLTLLLGSLMVLLVSATIMAASHILGKGKYDKYPPILWVLGVGAALATFGIAAIVLGINVINPFFYAGLGMIIVVAELIVKTSKILAKGNYESSGKMLIWGMATALIYGTFVPILLVLGAVGLASAVMSFFGPDPWKMAQKMIVDVAATIVAVSFILAAGKYEKGPTKEWAEGIAIALGAFSPLYSMLMMNGVMKIFGGGGVGPDDYANAIRTVSSGIMFAAELFASPSNKGVWKGGPPKEWAEGVGTAIGAFAPVFKILTDGAIVSLFGGKGVDAEAMKQAIKSIAEGIVDAANFFGDPKNKVAFTENYPKKEWGEGVGAALGAFSPVFAALQGKGWFSSGAEVIAEMQAGILAMADSIVKVAHILGGGIVIGKIMLPGKGKPDYTSYPSKEWGEGIKTTIDTFMGIFNQIKETEGGMEEFSLNALRLTTMMTSVAMVAVIMGKGKEGFAVRIPVDWMPNISKTLIGYAVLSKALEALLTSTEKQTKVTGGGLKGLLLGKSEETINVTKHTDVSIAIRVMSQVVRLARMISANHPMFSKGLSPNWMDNISKNLIGYGMLTKMLEGLIPKTETTKVTGVSLKNLLSGKFEDVITVQKHTDVPLVIRTMSQIVRLARLIHKNEKHFQAKIDPNFITNISKAVLGYALLAKQLEALLTKTEKETKVTSGGLKGLLMGQTEENVTVTKTTDISIVIRSMTQLVRLARMLHKNEKYFQTKIDPNFMSKISSNILAFAKLSKSLGVMGGGGIGGFLGRLTGTDPMSMLAKGMIQIAVAYDALSRALEKFGAAINSIDSEKVSLIRRLTGNLAILSAMDSDMFSRMMSVLESRASVFAKLVDTGRVGPSVGQKKSGGSGGESGGGGKSEGQMGSKYEPQKKDMTKQLDEVIKILKQISYNTSGLDDYLESLGYKAETAAKL